MDGGEAGGDQQAGGQQQEERGQRETAGEKKRHTTFKATSTAAKLAARLSPKTQRRKPKHNIATLKVLIVSYSYYKIKVVVTENVLHIHSSVW